MTLEMDTFPRACIHGRFQILHNDHVAYFKAAVQKYGRVYIGLTGLRRDQDASHLRGAASSNPLTYWERVQMWRVLLEDLASGADHIIGPFPIEAPSTLGDYVPLSCVCATTVREEWNWKKIEILQEAGYNVDVLYADTQKPLSARLVRDLIAGGSTEWHDLVPPPVREYLRSLDIGRRIGPQRDCSG